MLILPSETIGFDFAMELEYLLELIGTYLFAISGVLASEDEDKNWFGAAFTGFITAIGGGSLRDIILGSYPLVWVGDVNFLYAIILVSLPLSYFISFL